MKLLTDMWLWSRVRKTFIGWFCDFMFLYKINKLKPFSHVMHEAASYVSGCFAKCTDCFYELMLRSGLEQEDMRILYYYLTASLLPAITEQDFSTAPLVTSAEGSHFGRSVWGGRGRGERGMSPDYSFGFVFFVPVFVAPLIHEHRCFCCSFVF